MQDLYLPTNALAALANLAPQVNMTIPEAACAARCLHLQPGVMCRQLCRRLATLSDAVKAQAVLAHGKVAAGLGQQASRHCICCMFKTQ
jgi:hypothetical protein